MPLTEKGKKIKRAMEETYGEKQGERVFYASERSGRITGVAKKKKTAKKRVTPKKKLARRKTAKKKASRPKKRRA